MFTINAMIKGIAKATAKDKAKKQTMKKQRKLIQVKYPPFDTTVKTYADIYKYEAEMTAKDHKDLKAEIFKNKQWNN